MKMYVFFYQKNLYSIKCILISREHTFQILFKVGLSPSKKNRFICFNEAPLKMTKSAFYFTLIAVFVLGIFKFLS